MIGCEMPFENVFPYTIGKYAKEHKIPISATVELTPFCNFNCVMCYVRLSPEQAAKQGELLSKEKLLKIAREAKDMGTLYLTLTGGEPLSRPDFWDIYRELNKMGFLISILSNGSLIDEYAIEKFKEYGMPYSVKLTLYGANDETYKKVCNSNNGFTKIEKAVKLLKENKVPLSLTATIVKENADDLREMYEIAKNWGVRFCHTISVVKSARGSINTAETSRFAFDEFAHHLSLEQLEMHKFKNPESPFSWCSSYGNSFWLTWNGHLQLCSFMNGPYTSVDDGLEKAWIELNKKLKDLKNPQECEACKYSEFCQRCPGMLCAESGNAENVSDSVCNTAKTLFLIYQNKLKEEKG